MTTLRIVFLGTSAAVPQKERFLSSIAMQRDTGEIFLFDCGEGTQYQMMKFGVNFQRITKLFISHLHADHILGTFGLLNTMRLMDRTAPITIYGPPGTREFFDAVGVRTYKKRKTFTIDIQEVEEGLVCEEEDYRVFAHRTVHSVYTLAYVFVEKDRLGRFNKEKAKKLLVRKGEKWALLQKGKSVLSEDNKIITPEMVLGPNRRGFKVVVGYDGYYTEAYAPFFQGADVLILEATYSDAQEDLAKERKHSTARMSAKVAKKAQAKRLYLTHLSARFKEETTLLKEASEEFPGVVIAYDGLEISLNRKDLEKE